MGNIAKMALNPICTFDGTRYIYYIYAIYMCIYICVYICVYMYAYAKYDIYKTCVGSLTIHIH